MWMIDVAFLVLYELGHAAAGRTTVVSSQHLLETYDLDNDQTEVPEVYNGVSMVNVAVLPT